MAHIRTNPANLDSLSLSDTELDNTEDLFASPSMPSKKPKAMPSSEHAHTQSPTQPPDTEEDTIAAHESSLRRELSALQTMNQVISGVVDSLEKAKSNMDTVSATVNNASTLLTTWTRILSQTEHNQRLILNPNWQGASQDIADSENEEVLRRQEKERRREEEIRKEEAREREREEQERRGLAEGTTKGSRGRGKGVGRGVGRGVSNGYLSVGGEGGVRGSGRGAATASRRAATGIGHGLTSGRGRGRGRA